MALLLSSVNANVNVNVKVNVNVNVDVDVNVNVIVNVNVNVNVNVSSLAIRSIKISSKNVKKLNQLLHDHLWKPIFDKLAASNDQQTMDFANFDFFANFERPFTPQTWLRSA